MTTTVAQPAAPIPDAAELSGLEPIQSIKRRWPALLGALLSLLMVIGLGHELFDKGLAGLTQTAPVSPLFYLFFAAMYLLPPTMDYVIFRRLWGIPATGMVALHRKRIANDVVLGYSGEAYFYAWARQRTTMVAAPFGAVKDVTILSAMAGNAITLALLALALPLASELLTPGQFKTGLTAAAIIVAMSLPFLLFSRRVFSLQRRELWWVFAMHALRLVGGTLFIALAWHFAMPAVTLGMWILLAAARMLVSRLPFVPAKDVLFANFAILLIGQGQALSELLAFVAALTLLGHVLLIAGFALLGLVKKDL
ncbi:hypothetical protein [Sphingomonas turrisvirgatae]|uniref:Flippase-like domain-containing protein n=1 Tax=Sphingomonas turrisvirgatae TaxID=1888892 RepID=A0A1E3LQM5_9SPHN|nr:hypothetical protein [Sphingomonas turrisvirgatae]ODP36051.1 hypothetical protein BFL28_08175 [Sphingomonas turrisvirgatae]